MIAIPAGRITLSDRRTQRNWEVDLTGYEIAAHQVTQELYAQVTGLRPSTGVAGRAPVQSVSWWEMAEFCNALSAKEGLQPAYRIDAAAAEEIEWDRAAAGYRLPTEAEWEFACRAGTTGPRYGPLDDVGFRVARGATPPI